MLERVFPAHSWEVEEKSLRIFLIAKVTRGNCLLLTELFRFLVIFLPSCARLMKSHFWRTSKIAHFLSPNRTLSSSKCAKMWSAALGELTTLPRPRSWLKRGAPFPITPSVGTSDWTLLVMSGNWVSSVMESEPCFHSVTIVQAIALWHPLLLHWYSYKASCARPR